MMSDRLKIFNYTLSSDPRECDSGEPYSREIEKLLVKTYMNIQNKKYKDPKWLLDIIEKYPHVPAFKNYLSVFHNTRGEMQKAYEANHWLAKEHPDYLFGKLNLAAEYIETGRFEEVPKVLGQVLALKDLYPDRKVFHFTEFSAFLNISCRYLLKTENLEAVESRLEQASNVLGDDNPVIRDLYKLLDDYERELLEKENQTQFEKQDSEEIGKGYDISVQTNEFPTFHHPEIWALYEYELRIDHDILRNILTLPRETLLQDLETVLADSLRRYEFFVEEVEKYGYKDVSMTFPLHALFLLTELRATEMLPPILDHLRQGFEFLSFWYDDHLTETLWHCLFHLGQNDTGSLGSFLCERDVHYFSKVVPVQALEQIALQVPEKKAEVIQLLDEVLTHFSSHLDDPLLIDSEFISSLVTTAAYIDAEKFLPVAKKFYDLQLVDLGYAGSYEDLVKLVNEDGYQPVYEVFPNIYDHYQNIITNWHSYQAAEEPPKLAEELEKKIAELTREKAELEKKLADVKAKLLPLYNASRNDPCPCGSGKKFKKCCWGKTK